jgi:hypothetical protein
MLITAGLTPHVSSATDFRVQDILNSFEWDCPLVNVIIWAVFYPRVHGASSETVSSSALCCGPKYSLVTMKSWIRLFPRVYDIQATLYSYTWADDSSGGSIPSWIWRFEWILFRVCIALSCVWCSVWNVPLWVWCTEWDSSFPRRLDTAITSCVQCFGRNYSFVCIGMNYPAEEMMLWVRLAPRVHYVSNDIISQWVWCSFVWKMFRVILELTFVSITYRVVMSLHVHDVLSYNIPSCAWGFAREYTLVFIMFSVRLYPRKQDIPYEIIPS